MEELSGERFSYCPGLPAYAGDRMIRLTDADLTRILLEKYNGTVVLRARDCTRLRDREHVKGSAGLEKHSLSQWVPTRCHLSWLTNSDPVFEPKCGRGGVRGLSQ